MGMSTSSLYFLGKTRYDIVSEHGSQKKGTPSETPEPMGIP